MSFHYHYESRNRIAPDDRSSSGTVTRARGQTSASHLGEPIREAVREGGLLALSFQDGGNRLNSRNLYSYDEDGTVCQNLKTTHRLAKAYHYDALGRTIADKGELAKQGHRLRFSTKPRDYDTGLYYYGYRYYDPVTGRWPSRDPIGLNWRSGEFNEYVGILNNFVNLTDYLGLEKNETEQNKVGFEAATAAAELTRNNGGLEYCGLICCNQETGEKKFTPPHPGVIDHNGGGNNPTQNTCNPLEKGDCNAVLGGSDWKITGDYHSHPEGFDDFSDYDISGGAGRERETKEDFDRYLGTADGKVQKLETEEMVIVPTPDGNGEIGFRAATISPVNQDGTLGIGTTSTPPSN